MSIQITAFLAERRENWLKPRLKSNLSREEVAQLHQEANEKFSLAQWLPDAAKRAKRLSIVSHPSKFSHPSAKATSLIYEANRESDGYLRTGNVSYELDAQGDAAVLDVHKFLNLPLFDGQPLLNHLDKNTEEIQKAFKNDAFDYEEIRKAFLSITRPVAKNFTDKFVKQVYFPTGNEEQYHLLSILTPSGLITRLKNEIDDMRFSETTKEAKVCRKNGVFHKEGYNDIFDLTVIGYGGTKPQNISVLNNKNAGRAYLLPCLPPILDKKRVRLPRTNFFQNILYSNQIKDSILALHKLMELDINNMAIREAIDNILKHIIDTILLKALTIRQTQAGWSELSEEDKEEGIPSLPLNQKIWLDDSYKEKRSEDDEWLEEIAKDLARWIINAYETIIKKSEAFSLGDDELTYLKIAVIDRIKQDKEFFR